MANWQNKLDIRDIWEQAQDDEITVQVLAKTIADRLEKINLCEDEGIHLQRDDLVDEFRFFAEESDSKDEFDYIMSSLYDWGDTPLDNEFNGKKVCWIWT
jgi:hypothetical protein